jgi:PAS domain S-box-containing protein
LVITHLRTDRILTVNEAFLRTFGFQRAELEGRGALEVGIWEAPEIRAGLMEFFRREEEVTNKELRANRKDGSTLWVAYSARPVDIDGEHCLLTVAVDISALKVAQEESRRLEEEVQHAQKLESLGSLASGVAHDMNNILGAIQSVAEVLRYKVQPGSPVLEGLETVIKASMRGRDLVQRMTLFARKELKEAEPVDLNQLIREEAGLLDRTLLQKVKVELDLEEGLPLVMGERSNLGGALMNLAVNAVDAMPGGG